MGSYPVYCLYSTCEQRALILHCNLDSNCLHYDRPLTSLYELTSKNGVSIPYKGHEMLSTNFTGTSTGNCFSFVFLPSRL